MQQKTNRKTTKLFVRLGLLALALILAWVALPHQPQIAEAQNNLLANPSFEGPFQTYVPNPPIADCPVGPCTTAQMAAGWAPWWVSQDPADKDTENAWRNRMPEYKKAEAPFLNRVHDGASAQQYFTFWSSHTAGILQRVNVPNGARLRFTIYGQAWSTHDDEPTSNSPTAVNMKIGIDPTGGTSPFSGNVVWSGTQNPYDAYAPFAVEAVSQNSFVTVFTYAYQSEPRKHNDIYWDNASLTMLAPPASPTPNIDWQATQEARGRIWAATQTASAGQALAQATVWAQQRAATAQAQQQIAAATASAVQQQQAYQYSATATAEALPPPQVAVAAVPFYLNATPTPNAEGVIIVEVPPGGSIWSVAANAGITLDEILSFNNLSQDAFVVQGQPLIVGYGEPGGGESADGEAEASASTDSTESTEAQPTPTPVPPTPVPVAQLTIPTPQAVASANTANNAP